MQKTIKEHKNKKFHGNNLRTGRTSIPNQVYMVTTVTYQREPIFSDLRMGRIVINAIRFQHDREYVKSLSFVVMPDHVHWLIQLNDNTTLSSVIRQFKTYTSFKINLVSGFKNKKIWQSGYHDHALRKEEDIKPTARYLVANPLRAGLVKSIGDYPLWDATWL